MGSDLVAVEAVYHRSCYCKFHKVNSKIGHCSVGRPVNEKKKGAFDRMCDFIEAADDELNSLDDLVSLMQQFSVDPGEVYSKKTLKDELEKRYGSHIEFNEKKGKMNVVCFKDMASTIINQKFYTDRGVTTEDEHLRIVTAAAKLIRSEIRDMPASTTEYPVTKLYRDVPHAKEWVPCLLKTFMEQVVSEDLKQVSLCHAIVQAARPRSVISPVLFGVGIWVRK